MLRTCVARLVLAVALAGVVAGPVTAEAPSDAGGVKVGNPSILRRLVSAETVEEAGARQYSQLVAGMSRRGKLVPPDHPDAVRLRRIADRLLPMAEKFNARAGEWKWEVSLIRSPTINALCMPGGKIAIFTGIIDRLSLTDDEIAAIVGHEIAHALREHARERMAKSLLTNVGAVAVSIFIGGGAGDLARIGGSLMSLKFSRDDETEADLVGLELAARAGYDPRAAITLWQKMSAANTQAPFEWFSTHPAGETRIRRIEAALADVEPLYAAARARQAAN